MKRNNFFWVLLVFLAAISHAAEKKKKLTLKDLLKSQSGSSSSSRSATVAGVRGLDETGAGVDTKARNFVAVEKLEKVTISSDELKIFLAEGNLK